MKVNIIMKMKFNHITDVRKILKLQDSDYL